MRTIVTGGGQTPTAAEAGAVNKPRRFVPIFAWCSIAGRDSGRYIGGMTTDERETIVSLRYGPDAEVSIYSTERGIWAKCKKAGWRLHSEQRGKDGKILAQDWVSGPRDFGLSIKRVGRAKKLTGYAKKHTACVKPAG